MKLSAKLFSKFAFALSFALVLASLTSCQKKEAGWKRESYNEQDLTRSMVEAKLPRSLWEKITAVLHPAGEAPAKPANAEEDHGSRSALPSLFAPIKVYLIEKNKGLLFRGNTMIKFGPGGGEIDLKDYVQLKNGSFYFVVEFMPEVEKLDRRVFFLSNSPQRKIGKETLGAGCENYYDVSKAFADAVKGDGFLINTRDGRHVSALGGTYFFAASHEGQLHLAALTIKDSNYKKLSCR